jgi:hypothetical protein
MASLRFEPKSLLDNRRIPTTKLAPRKTRYIVRGDLARSRSFTLAWRALLAVPERCSEEPGMALTKSPQGPAR